MFALAHRQKPKVFINKYRMNQSHIHLLFQANVQERLHIQLNIIDLIALGIIDQHVTLLGLLLDTNHLLTQRPQLCRVMSDPAEGIDSRLAVVALACDIIRNRFRCQRAY
jgi:hypothetical protein